MICSECDDTWYAEAVETRNFRCHMDHCKGRCYPNGQKALYSKSYKYDKQFSLDVIDYKE